jgi:hypothetical protein
MTDQVMEEPGLSAHVKLTEQSSALLCCYCQPEFAIVWWPSQAK